MEFKDFLSLHTFLFFFHLSVIHMHINTHTHTRVPGEYACKRLPEIPCDCHPMGLCSRMIWFSQLPFFVSLTHAHRFSHTQANTRLDNQDGSSLENVSCSWTSVCVCLRACMCVLCIETQICRPSLYNGNQSVFFQSKYITGQFDYVNVRVRLCLCVVRLATFYIWVYLSLSLISLVT